MNMAVSDEDTRYYTPGFERLSWEEKRKAIDPDGQLPLEEVHKRISFYEQERSVVQMPEHRRVSNRFRVGLDEDGQEVAVLPGQDVDERGRIVTLDPERAAAAAERLKTVDERSVKQKARRSEAIQALVQTVLNRAETSTNAVKLPLERCSALSQEYRQAKSEGYQDSELDFLPLSAYYHKMRWDDPQKKPIRPMLKNEFGVFQMASNPGSPLAGRIVCVADKDANG